MATKQQPTSSGSDVVDQRYATYDERKRKRMISNRESARRSRMKKQQHLDELISQTSQLQEENKKLRQMIDAASHLYLNFASENNVLRAQVTELTDRPQSLNSVLQIASGVSGMSFDIPDIPDTLLEPWQLPCAIQPIPASANMFQY
ncbi:basic region/leucine zipper motif 53 [Abeliophyllum distichum]|uniref:Basic region/leucine zipper motif 53 n=1 Tax=Abeliophyllum distichum TaxID=126358 RepID=A0ABD1RBD7_9LAMI